MNDKINLIVFPSSYYDPYRIDDGFEEEYEAAINTGLYEIVLFGYDKWVSENKLVLRDTPEAKRKAIYRGWMLKPEDYVKVYDHMRNNNIDLITNPQTYMMLHEFPLVYPKIDNVDTAKIRVFQKDEKLDLNLIKNEFDRFMVKDFVKSVKGTEFPTFFDSSITDKEFDDWMKVFYDYRGNLFTDGICIKEYLDLKRYNGKTNEYRVFYGNQNIVSVSRNSLQPNYTPQPPRELIEKYRNLGSIYYAVDYAELDDGTWKIIETGDGQVSGLSEGQNNEQYYRSLYHALN